MASLKTCWVDEMHESLLLMFFRNVFRKAGRGGGGGVVALAMDVEYFVIWFHEGLEALVC